MHPDSHSDSAKGDGAQPIVVHAPLNGELDVDEADESRETVAPARGLTPTIATVDIRESDAGRASPVGDQSPAPPELAAGEAKRAFGLDALRGLFLVSMTLGFTIWSQQLPAWMYHRQFPPPGDVAVDISGISWRDLAYASFLFTMAAALPLTLSRRIDKGETEVAVVVSAFRRYVVLLVFAILIAHSNPYFLGYNQQARGLAIAGFCIMALVFTRRRKDWSERLYRVLNVTGWVLAVAFLAFTPLLYGKTFSFERIDDIIAGLAFASLAGSLIWYFTRDQLNTRLAILAIAAALYLGAKENGWIQDWWFNSPAPWAFEPSRFSLLTVVIPGTIVGDVILRWMRSAGAGATTAAGWSRGRISLLTALTVTFTPVVVVGLYNREVLLTTQVVIALLIGGLFITWRPATPVERMLRSLFLWGALWLVIGLFLEPSEGGIKKAPETLSYFFTVTGTTTMLLVALSAIIDALGGRRWVSALIDVGHNPLLTYVLYTVLLNSVLEMTPWGEQFLRSSAGESVVRSVIETAVVVLIVRFISRRRIYWRT